MPRRIEVFFSEPLLIARDALKNSSLIESQPDYDLVKSLCEPDGPEPHNSLLYCYEDTNITEERAVNQYKTELNDALNESQPDSRNGQFGLAVKPLQAWVC